MPCFIGKRLITSPSAKNVNTNKQKRDRHHNHRQQHNNTDSNHNFTASSNPVHSDQDQVRADPMAYRSRDQTSIPLWISLLLLIIYTRVVWLDTLFEPFQFTHRIFIDNRTFLDSFSFFFPSFNLVSSSFIFSHNAGHA